MMTRTGLRLFLSALLIAIVSAAVSHRITLKVFENEGLRVISSQALGNGEFAYVWGGPSNAMETVLDKDGDGVFEDWSIEHWRGTRTKSMLYTIRDDDDGIPETRTVMMFGGPGIMNSLYQEFDEDGKRERQDFTTWFSREQSLTGCTYKDYDFDGIFDHMDKDLASQGEYVLLADTWTKAKVSYDSDTKVRSAVITIGDAQQNLVFQDGAWQVEVE